MTSIFFFFNDTATTEIYTLSLHDALPILEGAPSGDHLVEQRAEGEDVRPRVQLLAFRLLGRHIGHGSNDGKKLEDRKSTRLNSSHDQISYAVFCLKKKTIRLRPLRV